MKNILLGIIAISLTFISANLALRSVESVQAQVEPLEPALEPGQGEDVNEIDAKTDPVIDEGEDSGEDLNEIAADTTGVVTATVSGDAEDSDDGEDPR